MAVAWWEAVFLYRQTTNPLSRRVPLLLSAEVWETVTQPATMTSGITVGNLFEMFRVSDAN